VAGRRCGTVDHDDVGQRVIVGGQEQLGKKEETIHLE
jgi:hypothetical protein